MDTVALSHNRCTSYSVAIDGFFHNYHATTLAKDATIIFISKPCPMIIVAWVIALVMSEIVHVFTLSLQDGFFPSADGL